MARENEPESATEAEPDEESVDSVVDYLKKYDEELIESGQILPEDSEELLLRGSSAGFLEEDDLADEAREIIAQEAFEAYAGEVRAGLTMAGLSDPSSVTSERLKDLDEEIIEQLDPINAECLFFDVARRVHRRLSFYEPISWSRLLEQAQYPPIKKEVVKPIADGESKNTALDEITIEEPRYVDLDQLRISQRLDDFNKLIKLGISPDELSRLVNGGPAKAQNINRLSYFLYEEPDLTDFRTALRRRQKRKGQPIGIEKTIRMAQIILRFRTERLEKQRELQSRYTTTNRWDSIDHDVYKRRSRRIRSSMAISNKVLEGLQLKSVEDFIDTLNGD